LSPFHNKNFINQINSDALLNDDSIKKPIESKPDNLHDWIQEGRLYNFSEEYINLSNINIIGFRFLI
jgi:hypothetical protein